MPRLAWFALAPSFLLSGCFSMMSQADFGMGNKKEVPIGAVALDAVTLPLQVLAVAGEGAAYYGGKALRGPSPYDEIQRVRNELAANPRLLSDRAWRTSPNNLRPLVGMLTDSKSIFSPEQLEEIAKPDFPANVDFPLYRYVMQRRDCPPELREKLMVRMWNSCRDKPDGGTCDVGRSNFNGMEERIAKECRHAAGEVVRRLKRIALIKAEQEAIYKAVELDPGLMLAPGWLNRPEHQFFAQQYALRGVSPLVWSGNNSLRAEAKVARLRLDERHLRVLAAEVRSNIPLPARYGQDFFLGAEYHADVAHRRAELARLIRSHPSCPVDILRELMAIELARCRELPAGRRECLMAPGIAYARLPDLRKQVAETCRHAEGDMVRKYLKAENVLAEHVKTYASLLADPDLLLTAGWLDRGDNRLFVRNFIFDGAALDSALRLAHEPMLARGAAPYVPVAFQPIRLEERHLEVLAKEALDAGDSHSYDRIGDLQWDYRPFLLKDQRTGRADMRKAMLAHHGFSQHLLRLFVDSASEKCDGNHGGIGRQCRTEELRGQPITPEMARKLYKACYSARRLWPQFQELYKGENAKPK